MIKINTNHRDRVIGKGLSLDVFDEVTGGMNTNTGYERVYQSVSNILNTVKGERFFLPEYGSRVHELLFEPNDLILIDLVKVYIKEDITNWEPRVDVISIDAEVDHNTLRVSLAMRLRNSNVIDNYVYEFNRYPNL